jgi:WD40 repeat protein
VGTITYPKDADRKHIDSFNVAVQRELTPWMTFQAAYVGVNKHSPFFALTPDGRSVVTASPEGELAWWDLRSRQKTKAFAIAKGYHALALSPDGLTAAVGIDGGIQVIDLRSGTVRTASRLVAGEPQWLLFSPDGEMVVSTGLDGAVSLWDVERNSRDARAATRPRWGSRASARTARHSIPRVRRTVIAWDIDGSRRLGRPFRFTHDRAPDPLFDRHPGSFGPDGRLIAVGLAKRGIQLRSTTDLARAGAPLLQTGGEVKALAFGPGGRALAAITRNGMATVWDVKARSLRTGLQGRRRRPRREPARRTMFATAGPRASVGRRNRCCAAASETRASTMSVQPDRAHRRVWSRCVAGRRQPED